MLEFESSLIFLPNPIQELLLKVILLDGERSQEAWRQWNASVEFDRLDYDSCCVIPSLYKTLNTQKLETPHILIMKGLYRKFWYKNQLSYNQLAILLDDFKMEGLSVIAIRGTAIALGYYQDYALRPIEELDLLIQTSQTEKFQQLLKAKKWQEIPNPPLNHSLRFLDPQTKVKLDLHKYILQTGLETESEDLNLLYQKETRLWQKTQLLPFKQHFLTALNPADQLLQVLIQGTNPRYVSPYRWVMDAYQIIKFTPDLDWCRFTENVAIFQRETPLILMLNYLKSCFEIEIPDNVR